RGIAGLGVDVHTRSPGDRVVREGAVARSGDDQHTGVPGCADRIFQGLREAAGGPAVVDDAGAPGRGVEDRLHGVCGAAVAAAVEDLQVHHAGAPRDTGDAHGVVALGGDDAGHVGAVAVVVERVGEVIGEVVAVHVVDVAVVVVVDEVAGDLARVGPEVGHQVRMA